MHPDLRAALDDITASTGGLSDAELAWHAPGKWSVSEVLEHLSRSYTGTTHVMRRALDQGQPKAKPDTFAQRVAAFAVTVVGYFPTGRMAPEPTRPAGIPPAEARRAVRDALVELDEVASRCATRLGERTKVTNHPVLGALNIRQWRRFHRVHARHHMKQVRRLKEKMAGQSK